MDFKDKQVLIIGLGESGLAMARWLHRQGARMHVADTRALPDRLPQLHALDANAQFSSGCFSEALLDGVDAIFVSPGLSPHRELKNICAAAAEKALPIWGELELFAMALASLREEAQYSPKLIAITGTNGKTTVTSLTALLCARAGLQTRVAGNISPAMLDVLIDALDNQHLPEVWVLELSSFQLHFCASFNPDVATVLNLTEDHLDWHRDMQEYAADKAKIFGTTGHQVLNRDDAQVMAMQRISLQNTVLSFSVDAPLRDGQFGLLREQGLTWLALAVAEEDEGLSSRRKKKESVEAPVQVQRLMPVDALKIRGQHNASNALAALALCRAIGLPLAPLLHGLRDYQGEPHRVELIAQIAGISFIDDSKGTNVGATVAALKGLGAEHQGERKQIILIAGGDGKGQDFSPLLVPVTQYVKAVYFIGKDALSLAQTLATSEVVQAQCESLESAVQLAADNAEAGDVVLLSPACASLDMFKNYAHRAEVFSEAVREFALSRGEVF